MLHLLLLVLGAMVLTNAVPHLVNGLSGRRFQSPFARPPGQGLSSPVTNVLWGAFNLVVGWALLHFGRLDLGRPLHLACLLLGLVVAGVGLAWAFGRYNAGPPAA